MYLSNPKVISFDYKIINSQPNVQKISWVLSYCVSNIPIRRLSSQKAPTQMLRILNISNIIMNHILDALYTACYSSIPTSKIDNAVYKCG